MDEHKLWHRRRLLEETGRSLEKNGFSVLIFESRDEALHVLEAQAAEAQNVGFGGSMTLAELGLIKRLEDAGKNTLVHGRPGLSAEERRRIMAEQQACDVFFTSSNAVTLQGQLVNIDATGNRVCAMAFGPRKVVVVAGANKVCHNLEAALRRVKEVACPPNARRLNFNTPCAKTGLCSDCNSPDRICRITTIIDKKPRVTEMVICLINEDLGY